MRLLLAQLPTFRPRGRGAGVLRNEDDSVICLVLIQSGAQRWALTYLVLISLGFVWPKSWHDWSKYKIYSKSIMSQFLSPKNKGWVSRVLLTLIGFRIRASSSRILVLPVNHIVIIKICWEAAKLEYCQSVLNFCCHVSVIGLYLCRCDKLSWAKAAGVLHSENIILVFRSSGHNVTVKHSCCPAA